ncbi:MAG: hypothetical protein ABH843_03265 [Candidatus Omnitrophota bacterium]
MKWQKVIGIAVAVVLLYSGVSIASYIHLYSPMFKADIKDINRLGTVPKNFYSQAIEGQSLSYINSKITVKDIVATKAPAPVSIELDRSMREQASLARSA